MNRSSKEMGAMESEDRRFRDLFGVAGMNALAIFAWLNHTSCLPEGGTFQHLLWTLCFMKVHPTETPLSALCGGSDPKTIRKWVQQFIAAMSALEAFLVSMLARLVFLCSQCALTFGFRLIGRTDQMKTKAMTAQFLWMEQTSAFPNEGSFGTHTNSRRVVSDARLVFAH